MKRNSKIYLLFASLLFLLLLFSCNNPKNEESRTVVESENTSSDFAFENITIQLPEGFIRLNDSDSVCFVNSEYPTKGDNIIFSFDDITESEIKDFSSFTEAYLLSLMRTEFKSIEKIEALDKNEINGLKCCTFNYCVDVDNDSYKIVQCYVLNGNRLISITLTSPNGDYINNFNECIKTIK